MQAIWSNIYRYKVQLSFFYVFFNTTLEGEAGEAGDFMKIYERPRIICINHPSGKAQIVNLT